MGTSGLRLLLLGLLILGASGCATDSKPRTAAPGASEVRAYIGHIADAWRNTPNTMGLLPALEAEAEVAARSAAAAVQKPDDLEWIKARIRGVRHAIDATTEATGPGLGYGAVVAAREITGQVQAAARVEGASENVKVHAKHVATSARNIVTWSEEIVRLSDDVLATGSASRAAGWVKAIRGLTGQIRNGVDADGDGKITWVQGEGGIAEVKKHLGFLKRGEGIP